MSVFLFSILVLIFILWLVTVAVITDWLSDIQDTMHGIQDALKESRVEWGRIRVLMSRIERRETFNDSMIVQGEDE